MEQVAADKVQCIEEEENNEEVDNDEEEDDKEVEFKVVADHSMFA